jgi:hypothetical protein
MRKILGAKGGLGGDEFELLPSSNGGAPARDWSSLAAQKLGFRGEKWRRLGAIYRILFLKKGNKIRRFQRLDR